MGSVLDTGSQRDPYNGDCYGIAQRFAPSFNPQTSQFTPAAYVYGIEAEGVFKAYPRDLLQEGENYDMINDTEITISKVNGKVLFTSAQGIVINDVEGLWFSWVAAHPETQVWTQ